MNLKKCAQGHFYDEDKNSVCPQCSAANAAAQMSEPSSSDATMPAEAQSSKEKTQKLSDADKTMQVKKENGDLRSQVDDIKTVGMLTNKPKGKAPVAGWLVCVEGKHYGEDFRITEGRNFIGRGNGMDIVLADDISVSREKHAIVIYEPNENLFHLTPGEANGLCYLNGQVVLSPQVLKRGDIIQVGRSKLIFVPFCGGKLRWKAAPHENKGK